MKKLKLFVLLAISVLTVCCYTKGDLVNIDQLNQNSIDSTCLNKIINSCEEKLAIGHGFKLFYANGNYIVKKATPNYLEDRINLIKLKTLKNKKELLDDKPISCDSFSYFIALSHERDREAKDNGDHLWDVTIEYENYLKPYLDHCSIDSINLVKLWLLVHHSTPEFSNKYFHRFYTEYKKGNLRGYNMAYMIDKHLTRNNFSQYFGTQLDNNRHFLPIHNFSKVDKRRLEFDSLLGTLETYCEMLEIDWEIEKEFQQKFENSQNALTQPHQYQ